MIEVDALTKRYGAHTAVDDLSFAALPGAITGFLGPNGAGKTTTMRMILGIDVPTSGSARVNGRDYRELTAPLDEIGALLDAGATHPGRPARDHLMSMAQTHGIGRRRVTEVIELVGLADVAAQRAGTFSLGMAQRLGVAAALLGDPGTLVLDEPVNGLDAEGIRWIRTLLKRLAGEGRTILLSSHLMSEMALTAERLIIVGRGRLISETTVEAMIEQASVGGTVSVRSPQTPELADALAQIDGAVVRRTGAPDELEVGGIPAARVGELAAARGVVLHELVPRRVTLEEAYMQLTGDSVQYRAADGPTEIAPEWERAA